MVGKTYWLAGSALALLVAAGPAMAADLPTPGPVYKAPVAPVNWTGFYIGAGGFAVFNANTSVQTAAGAPLTPTATQGGKGWLVTGFTGYDYQIGNIVAGVLGDFDWGSVTGGYLDPANGGTGTMKEKYQWAAGGRLGWLVFPEFLAYVSGGYTQAHFNGFGLTNGTTLPANTYNGWFASIGVDTTFPLLGNGWFFGSDYRFAQYNTASLRSDGHRRTGLQIQLRAHDRSGRRVLVRRLPQGAARPLALDGILSRRRWRLRHLGGLFHRSVAGRRSSGQHHQRWARLVWNSQRRI
jgi:outer membrane immunogenic protein